MIKIENTEVLGWEAALRGMRNPMNSWKRSDTKFYPYDVQEPDVGSNDFDLMEKLFKSGTEHRKYLRMIHIQMDITAPLYWWKEFDTYKVGTTANSCSTMHKIADRDFVLDDFSTEHLTKESITWMQNTVIQLNYWRACYLSRKDKTCWWQLIQLLPTSYNQQRTVDFDYETAFSMIRQRKGHKLDEWNDFVRVLLGLPYMEDLINGKKRGTAEEAES